MPPGFFLWQKRPNWNSIPDPSLYSYLYSQPHPLTLAQLENCVRTIPPVVTFDAIDLMQPTQGFSARDHSERRVAWDTAALAVGLKKKIEREHQRFGGWMGGGQTPILMGGRVDPHRTPLSIPSPFPEMSTRSIFYLALLVRTGTFPCTVVGRADPTAMTRMLCS